MRKVPFVEQIAYTDCGICAVSMVLKYYGFHESIANLKKDRTLGNTGTSMLDLQDILKEKKLKTTITNGIVNIPCIAHIDGSHFIVIEKIHNNKITYVDPSYGRRVENYEKVLNRLSNKFLYAKPGNDFKKKKESKKAYKIFVKAIFQQYSKLAILIILTMFNSLISIYISRKIGILIDNVDTISIDTLLFSSVVLLIVYYSITFTQKKIYLKYYQKLNYNIQTNFIRNLFEKNYSYFIASNISDIYNKPLYIQQILDFLVNSIITSIVDVITLFFVGIYIYTLSKILFILLTVLIFFYYIISKKFNNNIKANNQEEIIAYTSMNSTLFTAFQNIEKVKIEHNEKVKYAEWNKKYKNYQHKEYKSKKFLNIYQSFDQTFKIFLPVIILVLGLVLVYKDYITTGEVITIYTLSIYIFSSTLDLIQIEKNYYLTKSYISRIEDLVKLKNTKKIKEEIPLLNDIKLEKVSFRYSDKSPYILEDFTLHIPEKQFVVITGDSGKGKTTIINLILGLYDNFEGEIFIGQKNIKYIANSYYHKNIKVVKQRENLSGKNLIDYLGINDKEEEELFIELLHQFDLYNMYKNLNLRLYTPLSSMGNTFSGGQIQRLNIIKELLKKPKILILDESTNAIDSENKKRILTYLKSLNITIIFITHDECIIREAKKIIKL